MFSSSLIPSKKFHVGKDWVLATRQDTAKMSLGTLFVSFSCFSVSAYLNKVTTYVGYKQSKDPVPEGMITTDQET